MRSRKIITAASSAAALLLTSRGPADAAAPYFLPGGLVMMEVDSENFAGGDPASLVEIDPSTGNLINSVDINLPQTGPNEISESDYGTDHERQVNLSANGQYLTFIGYNAAPSTTTDPSTLSAAQAPRMVGLVDAYGNLNLSTKLTDAYDYTNIRGAYTTDGTSIWTAGDNASGAITDGGIRYTTAGSTTSVNLSQVQTIGGSKTTDNIRSVRVFDGQLFESSGSDASVGKGVFQVGTGLPNGSTGVPALTKLSSKDYSATGFYFLDTNHDGNLDTVYAADSTEGTLDKYCLIGGTWVYEGGLIINGGPDQCTAIENANGTATIYVGTLSNVYSVTDPSPYGGNMSSTVRTTLLSASNLTAPLTGDPVSLGGLDFAPQAADTNQWNLTSAGSWQTGTNWATGVSPNSIGATATFGTTLTQSATISLNGGQTVGHVVFNNSGASYTIGTSAGDVLTINDTGLNSSGIPSILVDAGSHSIQATLSLLNGVRVTTSANTALTIAGPITGSGGFYSDGVGSLTLGGVGSYVGNTEFASGTVTLAAAGSLPSGTSLTVGDGDLYSPVMFNISAGVTGTIKPVSIQSLTIAQNGTVRQLPPSNHASRTVLITSALNFAGTSAAWAGLLDLGGNDLIVHNGSLATLRSQLIQGYDSGHGFWQGSAGIISSTAAANTTMLTTLGVIQNSANQLPTGSAIYTTFDAQSVSSTDVLVKYTYYGDANLDGKVDGSDYSLIDNGYNQGLTGWINGDFNYDGVINGSDYSLIDNAYLSQGAQLSAIIASPTAVTTDQISNTAAVPEPASAALLTVGITGLLVRRRRVRIVNG